MRETWVQSLGWEDLLEQEMATHSSTLAWRSLVGYSPRGHKESDMTERLHFHLMTQQSHYWAYTLRKFKKIQAPQCLLQHYLQ